MPIIEPEFMALTASLDVQAFWEENERCQLLGTGKPRCSMSFSRSSERSAANGRIDMRRGRSISISFSTVNPSSTHLIWSSRTRAFASGGSCSNR